MCMLAAAQPQSCAAYCADASGRSISRQAASATSQALHRTEAHAHSGRTNSGCAASRRLPALGDGPRGTGSRCSTGATRRPGRGGGCWGYVAARSAAYRGSVCWCAYRSVARGSRRRLARGPCGARAATCSKAKQVRTIQVATSCHVLPCLRLNASRLAARYTRFQVSLCVKLVCSNLRGSKLPRRMPHWMVWCASRQHMGST